MRSQGMGRGLFRGLVGGWDGGSGEFGCVGSWGWELRSGWCCYEENLIDWEKGKMKSNLINVLLISIFHRICTPELKKKSLFYV